MAIGARELEAVVYRFPAGRVRGRRVWSFAAGAARRTGVWVLVLALTAVLLLAGGPEARAPAAPDGAPKKVVLGAGETLWGIAERYAPQEVDPRAYVDALLELNGLETPPPPGTRLRLP